MPWLDQIGRVLSGLDPLTWWLAGLAVSGLIAGVLTGFLQARKIQPNGFRWRIFRGEVVLAVVNLSITVLVLGTATKVLQQHGIITFDPRPASPWTIAFEFALYFLGFDTWFYWWHRLMHVEPFYRWSHKLHHRSISPNPLTTWAMNPIESIIEGAWLPLFTALMTVHTSTMVFIAPFAAIMGLYVHSGFELFPRWWNRSWATKWFITATFHDQHHRYFKGNYGGFTTIWDWICGTVRPTFLADYEKVTARPIRPLVEVGKRRAGA